MKFINHRQNSISDLANVPKLNGVEIDLRSNFKNLGKIHLSHDPWQTGDDFEEWLAEYKLQNISGPLILNTKEDGLESRILELLATHKITNYFFLDTPMPTLIKWTHKNNISHFALRVSAYEPVAAILNFEKMANWIWVDCFEGIPMPLEQISILKSKFKICLVSPELQGKELQEISKFKELFCLADAVCTKKPEEWLSHFG